MSEVPGSSPPRDAYAPWLPLSFRPSVEALNLLCFPYAGGGTAIYHRWQRRLATHANVIPVCLPGRERRWREPAYSNVTQACEALEPDIVAHVPTPIALLGHSMGAVLAYEIACRLNDRVPGSVKMLIVSACPAPHLVRDRGRRLLSDEALVQSLVDDFSADNLRSDDEIDLMRLMLPTLRADLTLFETYVAKPQPQLVCPILAIGGASDEHVSRSEIEAWRDYGGDGTSTRMLPGGHFYFQDASQEEMLVALLASRLESVGHDR